MDLFLVIKIVGMVLTVVALVVMPWNFCRSIGEPERRKFDRKVRKAVLFLAPAATLLTIAFIGQFLN